MTPPSWLRSRPIFTGWQKVRLCGRPSPHLIEVGLARQFGLPGELQTRVLERELDRVVNEAHRLAWQTAAVFVGPDVVQYAASNQLTVRGERRAVLSSIGEILQHLQGRDAVRWLLQVEARLAIGPFDPERISKESAEAILTAGTWASEFDPSVPASSPCHENTADRLVSLGLLSVQDTAELGYSYEVWSVTLFGQELLRELISPNKTPLALLAESLCSDLVSSAMQTADGIEVAVRSSAAEATASTARMVAHEARNALLPVQAALDSLYREILVQPPLEVLQRRRPIIDSGIKGALQFTKKLLQTAELGAKPPERFEPVQAVCEVLDELRLTSQVAIESPPTSALPLLLGRRDQFVLAVRAMVNNAIQHGGADLRRIQVGMTLDEQSKAVVMCIDDDGRGVPESERGRIFQAGVSQNFESTGLGLSLVKRVFEEELRGVVECHASELGGARFAVRLPSALSDQPPRIQELRR